MHIKVYARVCMYVCMKRRVGYQVLGILGDIAEGGKGHRNLPPYGAGQNLPSRAERDKVY